MLVEIINSSFGIVVVHRNLSLLEKTELISHQNYVIWSCLLSIPFSFFLFFKELSVFVTIYIGIFCVTLIVHDKIIRFFHKKTFEKQSFFILERLILLLQSGKSASASVKTVFFELKNIEKDVFEPLNRIFFINKDRKTQNSYDFYFHELQIILNSPAHVAQKLISMRESLKILRNLRHRSRQSLHLARAQAFIAAILYVFFVVLSRISFNLSLLSPEFLFSITLFGFGQLILFKLGQKIKWKT